MDWFQLLLLLWKQKPLFASYSGFSQIRKPPLRVMQAWFFHYNNLSWQCQLRPFSMLLESKDHLLPGDVKGGDKNGVRGVKEDIDKGIFQQFKLSVKEKDNCASSCSSDEGGSFQLEEEVQESRKRRNPFQGWLLSSGYALFLILVYSCLCLNRINCDRECSAWNTPEHRVTDCQNWYNEITRKRNDTFRFYLFRVHCHL